EGRPTQLDTDGPGLRIAVGAGTRQDRTTGGPLTRAPRTLAASGAEGEVFRGPRSFQPPVGARAALGGGAGGGGADGGVIRGGTPHFEFVSNAATDGLTRVALDTGKPVGFGVLTLDDEQQGIDRAGFPGSKEDKGQEAAEAVLATARVLRRVRGTSS